MCDADLAVEPIFGSCSGVFLQRKDGSKALLTANHCICAILADQAKAFVFFDYDILNQTVGSDSFTSANFAQLDLADVQQHPALDIAMIGLDWQMGTPPVPVTAAPQSQPYFGQLVGSVGYPSGRPRKRIFGQGVTVGKLNPQTFGAFIDSFAISSGSLVFNFQGEVLGVLSHQKDITDYVAKSKADPPCEALAVVSSIVREGPTIVKLSTIN